MPLLRRRLSPHQTLTWAIAVLTASFVIMVLLGVHAPYWLLLVAGALEGFGNGACFNELQVKVQVDAAGEDVAVATSFSFLIRMLSQTFTTALFGQLMNRQLAQGVARQPHITMAMMNQLSDAAKASRLPRSLVPAMRHILFTGLHHIMWLSLTLMLLALALNLWAQRSERLTASR